VYHGGKCSIEINAVQLPRRCNLFLLQLPQIDGVSITGDLPLLSLGRKIVVQPRHLLHISARGGSELEFTSIASTLTGLKVVALKDTTKISFARCASHVAQVSSLNVSVGGVAVIACEYVITGAIQQLLLGYNSRLQIRSASNGGLTALFQARSRKILLP
jgi:hypothetical protein